MCSLEYPGEKGGWEGWGEIVLKEKSSERWRQGK